MRISLNSLPGHLKKGFAPVHLLFGAEPLLIEEALDLIRTVARENGIQERVRLTAERGFDWNLLLEQGQAMSLFAEKKLIELRLPTGKPGDAGTKAILEYCERLPEDTVLIIVSGPVDKRSQGTRWFKAVDNAGAITESPEIRPNQLPNWIGQRLSENGLQYDRDAVIRICHMVEGNLLAAAQEINLLSLLYPGEKITVEVIENTLADHARFDVFSFSDACLRGSAERAIRILQSMKREQAEPILVLWALTREARTMCQISAASEKGGIPIRSLFDKFRIWQSRQPLVESALKRLGSQQWENVLKQLGRADLMLKGSVPLQRSDIWEEIESISLSFCGTRIP